MSYERYLHDPVPRNVSKFPIHQTYLTSDAERTGKNGYKFKVPEVWDSARSGKKSIAFKSVEWISKPIELHFYIDIHNSSASNHDNDIQYEYIEIIPPFSDTRTIIGDILQSFNNNTSLQSANVKLITDYTNNILKFAVVSTANPAPTYQINIRKHAKDVDVSSWKIKDYDNTFNLIFNQPFSKDFDFQFEQKFYNVWDRITIYFHSSFIPFDNYQFLAKLFDKWDKPIIYQDPNTSPLFNIWTTTDLKNELPILHEEFIIRISFIISSESIYKP